MCIYKGKLTTEVVRKRSINYRQHRTLAISADIASIVKLVASQIRGGPE